MKIMITPMMLCDMLGGRYTLEACEAICEYYELWDDCENTPYIGDIAISFAELDAEDIDEDDKDRIIKHLSKGRVLVSRR